MADWKLQLRNALEGAKPDGNFAVTGTVDGPLPQVAVRGVGNLALPIDAGQAADLIFAGLPAPYGKGSATVLDPAVRRAIQIQPERVRLSDDWDATVRCLATDTAAALGLPGGGVGAGVEARLYKLLVYERGGHFKAHRDTEKEPGMFGTLLVQLPVAGGHTGGRLTIRHQGQEVAWDTAVVAAAGAAEVAAGDVGAGSRRGSASPLVLHYAAFYADCEHELSEVESGLRVVLAYNLVRVGQQAAAQGGRADAAALTAAPASEVTHPVAAAGFHSSAGEDSAVTAAVRAWEAAGAAAQPLVTIPLAHKYTAANLGFGALKGDDGAKVQALLDCQLLDVHLVLVTKQVEGRCKEEYSDSDDFEYAAEEAVMYEVDYDTTTDTLWVSPLFGHLQHKDGFGLHLEPCLLEGSELFPEDSAEPPDERQYEPWTGNEGPSLAYWYHRALVVAWPRSRRSQLWAKPGNAADALTVAKLRLQQAAGSEGGGGSGSGGGESSVSSTKQLAHLITGWGAATMQEQLLQQYLLRLQEQQPYVVDDACWLADTRLALQTALDCAAKDVAGGQAIGTMVQQALELLSSEQAAQLCGEHWREQACVRLVQGMAQAASLPDLEPQGLREALAATAAALQSDSFNSAVVELVARQAPRQLQGCYQLVTQEALPAALRERAARTFRTAVFGAMAAAAAGAADAAGSGSGAPTSAAPASSSGCLAQLPQADVHFLAGLVFAAEGADATPCSGMAGAFAAAVLRRPDCQQSLLPALLKEPAVRGALAARPPMPAAVQLAQGRIAHLEPRVALGIPKDDFSMPIIIRCRDPKLREFLLSPEQERVFGDFTSWWDAQQWASSVAPTYEKPRKFQAIMTVGEDGRRDMVRVIKDPGYMESVRVLVQQAEAKELAEVRALLGLAATADAGAAALPSPGI